MHYLGVRRKIEPERPRLSADRDVCGKEITYRCGRPFESSFLDDRKFLFWQYMNSIISNEQKRYIASFSVSRSMFHNFFVGPDGQAKSELGRPNHNPSDPVPRPSNVVPFEDAVSDRGSRRQTSETEEQEIIFLQ